MFQVAIYLPPGVAPEIKRVIEEVYNPVIAKSGGEPLSVAAFTAVYPNGLTMAGDTALVNLQQMCAMYRKKAIQAVIVPIESCIGWMTVITQMMVLGIDIQDIYVMKRVKGKILKEQDISSLLVPYLSSRYLGYLEFHIADHCNLKCKACEHYSGLLDKPKFPDYKKFERDMQRLHQLIDDIGLIRILGGEPLLNPDIENYIVLARSLYPEAVITVVTNAILLMKMPDSFYRTLREQNAQIWISYYLPLRDKMEDIQAFLREQNVQFTFSDLITHFRIRQTLQPHNHPEKTFYECFQAHCNNFYDGKMASCFLPFTTKYFNEYFDEHLPEDGAIDLWEPELTTELLKARLLIPLDRCRYCGEAKEVPWDRIKNPSELSDWIVE